MTPQQQLAAIGIRAHQFVDEAVSTRSRRTAARAGRSRHPPQKRGRPAGASPRGAGAVLPRLGAAGADAARDRRPPAVSAPVLAQPEHRRAPRGDLGRRARAGSRSSRSPPDLQRLVQVADDDGASFVFLEDLIRLHLAAALSGTAYRRSVGRSGCRAIRSSNSTTRAVAPSSNGSNANCGAGG